MGPPTLASFWADALHLFSGAGFCQLLKQWAPPSGRLGSTSAQSPPKWAEGLERQPLRTRFNRAVRQVERELHCSGTRYAEPWYQPGLMAGSWAHHLRKLLCGIRQDGWVKQVLPFWTLWRSGLYKHLEVGQTSVVEQQIVSVYHRERFACPAISMAPRSQVIHAMPDASAIPHSWSIFCGNVEVYTNNLVWKELLYFLHVLNILRTGKRKWSSLS